MIKCPVCKRYVPLVQKGYRIYCPECGNEITYSEKNISPEQHDSASSKVKRTGT